MPATDPTDPTDIDFRKRPDLYRVGKGEQGVLQVEPYKSEILPHWRFKTPTLARRSSMKIYRMFLEYKAAGDFVGMDMARKFLQMGYTRSRRYANHKSGRKYADDRSTVLPRDEDPIKAESARIFYARWQKVRNDRDYLTLRAQHRKTFETKEPPTGRATRRKTSRARGAAQGS